MAERLGATVQLALDANLLTLPSVDVRSLGAIVDAAAPPDTTAPVPVRVVDGALVAGLNVEGFMPPWQPPGHTGGITLHGQTFALEDFAGDYDLAVVTNPDALPILLAGVEEKIVNAVGAGNTIESLTLTAGAGAFGVAGRASNSDGHATFSFSIVPHMDAVRPGGAINFIEKPFVIHPRPYRGAVVLDRGPEHRRLDGPLVLGDRPCRTPHGADRGGNARLHPRGAGSRSSTASASRWRAARRERRPLSCTASRPPHSLTSRSG